jgi:hypothetical protein
MLDPVQKNVKPVTNPTEQLEQKTNQEPADNHSGVNSVDKPKDRDAASDASSLWDDDRMAESYYWWE